jgi:hypothetical protein
MIYSPKKARIYLPCPETRGKGVCVCRYIYDPQDQHSQNSEASSILTENMLGIWFWFLPGNREDTLDNVFIKVKREEE